MRRLGDKITSKLLAEASQIPVAPWSGGPVETVNEAWRHAEKSGIPSAHQSHGRRRRPRDPSRAVPQATCQKAFESARAEAYKAFGNPTVFWNSW